MGFQIHEQSHQETLTDAISYFKNPLPVAKKYLDKGSVLKIAIKIPVYLFAYFSSAMAGRSLARALPPTCVEEG